MGFLVTLGPRRLSVAGFSLLFAYLLSFVFEGQVLYGLLEQAGLQEPGYILVAILVHFVGLLSCGYLLSSRLDARRMMLVALGGSLISSLPFFFAPSIFWAAGLVLSAYAGGCAVACWGAFLKAFTPRDLRLKSCAQVLIFSNLLMILCNVTAVHLSPHLGLVLSMVCLVAGFITLFPLTLPHETGVVLRDQPVKSSFVKPLLLLCLFIIVITINSGLMYQVINPAFDHLEGLVSWYWALPYIVAIGLMSRVSSRRSRSPALYLAMAMMVAAFLGFMLLGRGTLDYLLVDTLMLGALGLFDLFWWSIIAEMLDYARYPVRVFGLGLSANVLGVLFGDVLGVAITSMKLPGAEVTVIALTVACITLVMLPPLNHQLVLLLKNHVYLTNYDQLSREKQTLVLRQKQALEPLTGREEEVLQSLLTGKSNREISQVLSISESTVKTHVRNIFSKYDVASRAELISRLLQDQISDQP